MMNTQHRPDAQLILLHYFTSGVAFLILCAGLAFHAIVLAGHYFQPKLLAFTHLAVLGWLSLIIFGALYQLLPVITGRPLYSPKSGYLTYILLITGLAGLIYSFWTFSFQFLVYFSGSLIILSICIFAFNIFLSSKGAKTGKTETDFILSSIIWLLVTVVLGFLLVIHLRHAIFPLDHLVYLKLHVHTGLAGWFLLLVIGVSGKLIPMFTLTHQPGKIPLEISYWTINAGLVAMVLNVFLWNNFYLDILITSLLAGGVFSYLFFIFNTVRNREKKKNDAPVKFAMAAILFLLIPVSSGIIISLFPETVFHSRLPVLYGTSFFIGFLGLMVCAMTYKTLPFIIWLDKFQSVAGKSRIPLPAELLPATLLKAQGISFIIAFFLIITGSFLKNFLLLQGGAWLLFLSAAVYNLIIYSVLVTAAKHQSLTLNTLAHGRKN